MILRVYRGSAGSEDRELVVAHLRDGVFSSMAKMRGLRSFQAGMRDRGDGRLEFVLVSTWDEFDDLVTALGPDLEHPTWLQEVAERIRTESVEHFELVGEELRGVIPLTGARLGVTRGTIEPGTAESFFDLARSWQTDLLDRGDVLAMHIGRQIDGPRERAIVVLVQPADGGPGGAAIDSIDAAWRESIAGVETAAYDALARVTAKPGATPALLLADDERRYVFATPAAGRLLGRPVSRLLGRRVEDVTAPELQASVIDRWQAFLADGHQAGTYVIRRDDGTTSDVVFEARANTPWPGCHVSVLSDPSAPVDLDDALAAAGLIARYIVAARP